MSNLKQQIEEIEIRAADTALLASLSADPVSRSRNRKLSRELLQDAIKLRSQCQQQPADQGERSD